MRTLPTTPRAHRAELWTRVHRSPCSRVCVTVLGVVLLAVLPAAAESLEDFVFYAGFLGQDCDHELGVHGSGKASTGDQWTSMFPEHRDGRGCSSAAITDEPPPLIWPFKPGLSSTGPSATDYERTALSSLVAQRTTSPVREPLLPSTLPLPDPDQNRAAPGHPFPAPSSFGASAEMEGAAKGVGNPIPADRQQLRVSAGAVRSHRAHGPPAFNLDEPVVGRDATARNTAPMYISIGLVASKGATAAPNPPGKAGGGQASCVVYPKFADTCALGCVCSPFHQT